MRNQALHSLLSALTLPPAVAAAELNFQDVILDRSYFAYEQDVGDIDGDGDNDIACIRNWNSPPT